MSEQPAPVLVAGTHELVNVEGPDARRFLQGLISQDVDGLAAGVARRSFLLSPQGRLRALLWVFADADRIGLITDAGIGERVVADLARFKIRVKVTISPPVPVWQLIGSGATSFATAIAAPLGDRERAFVTKPIDSLEVLSQEEWDLLRIEEAEPRMDVDVDERTIPQESGLVPESVSFSKGCYLGQELVSRIDTRGHVNRHLRGLELPAAVLVPARVAHNGEDVGEMTSISRRSPDDYVALAMVHRKVEPGAVVEVGGQPARVRKLPVSAD
jgi:folate-binding protein YgfZ